MKQIDGKTEIIKFDGINDANVYKGSFHNLKKAMLKWNIDEEMKKLTGFGEHLTLNEIAAQLEYQMITIFLCEPMGGKIYQYGNYGDSWWEIGELDGYA